MNPAHLRTFLAVQKHLNYTRAGEELFISQPAVSRQMQQLEADLGVQLVEQIGKKLHLTPAGETLVRESERVLGDLERLAERVRAHASGDVGWLRIGASTTPGYFLLPRVLGEFHQQFSKVELHYTVDNSSSIERLLIRNELDVGFVGSSVHSDSLTHEAMVDDEVVCFTSSRHPLARSQSPTAKELAEHVLVSREEGSATFDYVRAWLNGHGVEARRRIVIDSPEGLKALVAAGIGYSFMSVHGLTDEFDRGTLTRLDLPDLDLHRPIQIVRHKDKHMTPTVEAFLTAVAEAYPRGPGRR